MTTETKARFERRETLCKVNNELTVRIVTTLDHETRTIETYFGADGLGVSKTFAVDCDDFDAWDKYAISVVSLQSWLREHGMTLNRIEDIEADAGEIRRVEGHRVIGHVARASLRNRLQTLIDAVDNFDYLQGDKGPNRVTTATLWDHSEEVADAAASLVARCRDLVRQRVES